MIVINDEYFAGILIVGSLPVLCVHAVKVSIITCVHCIIFEHFYTKHCSFSAVL